MTMRGILNLAGQCFAVVAVTIGLSSYGCMDVTSVNPVVELASLTVTPGTLQPGFTGGTTQYTVDLTRDVTSVRLTAQPAVAGDTLTINGQATTSSTIALGPEGSTTSVSIVVSESSDNSRTYIVLLKRASLAGNNSLQSLTVSPGTLAPAFNANTLIYSVDVANNVDSVTVTPTLSDPAATMTVNGDPATSGQASTVSLNGPGQSTVISIVVTAQNATQKTYRVTVNRGKSGNNFLKSLEISPGSLVPVFSDGTEGYTVNLPSILPGNPTTMTVTPTLQDATATMKVNGQDTNSGQARTTPLPAPGESTFINIVVTAQNGITKTYSINVIRVALNGNNKLSALALSPGSLNPSFGPDTEGYTVDLASILPGNPTSMTVTPTLQDATATMKVNGQDTNSGQARTTPLPAPGESTFINIVVTAQNGITKTYSINVIRVALNGNNKLSALGLSPGPLNPSFGPDTEDYTVDLASILPGNPTSMTVTPTLQDLTASMTVNGQPATSGQPQLSPLPAPGSTTIITIVVTAQNGDPRTYTVNVTRDPLSGNNNLSALTVSSGTLTPAFAPVTNSYTVDVATDVPEVTVTATKSDPNAVLSGSIVDPGSGQATGQATIPLDGPGTSKDISITVTAPNGSSKIYTITVNRAASSDDTLSALTVTPSTWDPNNPFNPNTTSYTVDVATDVTEVIVSATKSDSNAVMLIGSVTVAAGTASGQETFPLNGAGGPPTILSIDVTAQSGGLPKTYTITVNRAAPAAPPPP